MSETSVEVSARALKERLGRFATGASRDIQAAADLAQGEQLRAVAVALWQKRGWIAVATDVGLRLARRPLLFGRRQGYRFDWSELTNVHTGAQRTTLSFGADEVALSATGPHDEFVRLVEAARSALHESERPSVDELRDLAKTKLGRFVTFGFEAMIDALPDRLQDGERVERLAGASLDFAGLLVLTDRRLLLLEIGLRRASDREWSLPRNTIARVEAIDDELRLVLHDEEVLVLRQFMPPERRDEFAVALR